MSPYVGVSIWDGGAWDFREGRRASREMHCFESELADRLFDFRALLCLAEFAQEADYQNKDLKTWSRLDLRALKGFSAFLLENQRLGLHLKHMNVDIADYENETHREWSVAEIKLGLEFAMRLGADVAVLHPGTFNERSGRFWPSIEDLPDLNRNRRIALEKSLAEIAGHFVSLAADRESRMRDFERREKALFDEFSSLLGELRTARNCGDRFRLCHEGLEIISRYELSPEIIRHCQSPWSGLHVCIENLEPPNFLVCTPAQVGAVFGRFNEFYHEAASHAGFSVGAIERYEPGLAVDPGHLLNSKVILTQEQNKGYFDIVEGSEDLHLNFVHLPGEYPRQEDRAVEPLLNSFVRKYSGHIHWVHLHGCQRTDTCMTTHGPVKAFRNKAMAGRGIDGARTTLYSTGSFIPSEELNLEEVVQVLGPEASYVAVVLDAPVEAVKNSVINLHHYIEYLENESLAASERIRAEASRLAADGALAAGQSKRLEWIVKSLADSRFYLRPIRGGDVYWAVGYDEVGFYRFTDDLSSGNVDIFATVKQRDGAVWLKGVSEEKSG